MPDRKYREPLEHSFSSPLLLLVPVLTGIGWRVAFLSVPDFALVLLVLGVLLVVLGAVRLVRLTRRRRSHRSRWNVRSSAGRRESRIGGSSDCGPKLRSRSLAGQALAIGAICSRRPRRDESLAPLFTARRMRRMDVPSTLRVVE